MTEKIIISHYAPCIICRHLKDEFKCLAFPSKIPNDILSGANDHSEKHPDQKNEIVFEKIEEDPEE